MKIVTKCEKRQNGVQLILSSHQKTIQEFVYSISQRQLIGGRTYQALTLEELRFWYIKRLNRYLTLGYEVKGEKEGKIILFPKSSCAINDQP
ncbi:MAG: hypothetical protein GX347_05360 [Epulopiscium sp.]|nr:hypothetical protein [Candidatus Epulonipiscium sp.]